MPAKRARDGEGHRAYRRKQAELKRRTNAEGLLCAGCGGEINTSLPRTHPMSFTADHPEELQDGGHLVKQELKPMHRSCNSRKSRQDPDTEIWAAT